MSDKYRLLLKSVTQNIVGVEKVFAELGLPYHPIRLLFPAILLAHWRS
jgi:hypothetical protein